MKTFRSLLIVAAAVATAGCGRQEAAQGDVSSIIVVADSALWQSIGDSVLRALEPPMFTVRSERTFDVMHVDPSDPAYGELRELRQVLAIGAATDPWVAPVLEHADEQNASGIVRTRDVWSRNQFATALVLPATNDAAAALPQIDELAEFMDSTFRAYAIRRMYTSAADTLLRDSLRAAHGFSILLPNVYETLSREGNIALFQNSTQIGGDLVRSVLIASRPGAEPPTAAAAIAWRDSLASAHYRPPQITEMARIDTAQVDGGVEIQGAWSGTDPGWPTAGPFIARMIACPAQNRTFLIDTWLFAPSRKKYEYMVQLQTILSTFECAA